MRSHLSCATFVAAVVSLSAQPALGPQQFSQDLQYLVTQLPQRHINLFFQTSQADWQAAAQQLQNDIPQLNQYQFYTRLSALVALARDGHTSLLLSPAIGFTQLPITLKHFSDGYFVTAAPVNLSYLNRAKLVSIGGTPVSQVLTALEPVISHENEYWFEWLAAQGLANVGAMRGLGFLPLSGLLTYGFQLDSGAQTSVDLSNASSSLVRAIDTPSGYIPPLDSSTQNYWSVYWPQNKTVYVRIASFHASDGGAQVAADTLGFLDNNPVDALIFDTRDDAGGDLTIPFLLLEGLLQRLGTLRANPRFQVYSLVNGGSYSSGSVFPALLKITSIPPEYAQQFPWLTPIGATMVGEPTGGPVATHFNPLTFPLPASGVLVQYATAYLDASTLPGIPNLDALYPDIPVTVQSTDYFARHDAILAAVLARASPPPAAPTGDAIVVNSASFRTSTGIAPGSFASAFGTFPLGKLDLFVNGQAAASVGGTISQLVFIVPADTAAGTATLEVKQNGQVVSSGQFQVTAAGPGLFVVSATSSQPGAILNQNGALNTAGAPAASGSVLQIFGTGYGPLDPSGHADASVWIANLPATVLYSGQAPGIPGLWQINARIPDGVPAGQTPVFVAALGLVSNGVTFFLAQ